MEIAIVSNICANLCALNLFLDHIKENQKIERIINAGNFLEIGPRPRDVAKKIITDPRFVNVLSQTDVYILNLMPKLGSHLSYFSWYDWALYQLGLNLASKLKELPTESVLTITNHGKNAKTILATYSFPPKIPPKLDYIVIGDHPRRFIGNFHGIKVICPGIFGYSKKNTIEYATLNTETDAIEFHKIQYNPSQLFSDYRKNKIPEKKEIIMTYHKNQNQDQGSSESICKWKLLDEVDKKILKELDKDARISLKQIGAELGLTHTTMYNHLTKLMELKIIRACTIEVDPEFIDTSTLHFYEIHTVKTQNAELDRVTARAYADYLMQRYGDSILFCSVGDNNRVYVITHFLKAEEEEGIVKDLESNKTFVEGFTVSKDNKIVKGFRLFSYNKFNPEG